MIFVVFLWNLRARAPGRLATSMKVRSATTIDGRRRAKVSEARHGRRRARKGGERPRRPDRALSDRGTRSAGPEATRPCAGPPEARARRGAKAGSGAPAGARRRRIETVRRATTIDGPPTGHGVRPRSPRSRAKAVRRAAPSHTARRDGGAVDSVVARPPGRCRPFARKASRTGSIFWAKPRWRTLYGTRGGTIRMWMMCERERGRGRVVDVSEQRGVMA